MLGEAPARLGSLRTLDLQTPLPPLTGCYGYKHQVNTSMRALCMTGVLVQYAGHVSYRFAEVCNAATNKMLFK